MAQLAQLHSHRALITRSHVHPCLQSLRNRFVTGDWAEGAKRATARPGADGSDEEGDGEEGDEEAFGEFEDMETGEAFKGGQVCVHACFMLLHFS